MTARLVQSHWSSDVVLTDADWMEIEGRGGVAFNGDQRRQLIEVITQYRESADALAAAVAPAVVGKALKRMDKSLALLIADLRTMLTKSGRPALRELARYMVAHHKEFFGRQEAKDLISRLDRLSAAAKSGLASLPSGKGRPGDPHLSDLLLGAHAVFALAGGGGIYTSSALRFLMVVCRKAGQTVQSVDALKKRVTEALEKSRLG